MSVPLDVSILLPMFVPLHTWAAFAALSLALVLTPGPNMIYLVSRALSQGWRAGAISLVGTVAGYAFFVLSAALGLTAIAFAVPFLYEVVKFAGALYLLWLAWQSLRPGGTSVFATGSLASVGGRKLVLMGLFTSLLNPKVALFYIALLPQFVDPALGHVFAQHIVLGVTQIVMSAVVNFGFVMSAHAVARFLARHPLWLVVQRYVMGVVLGALAVRLAFDRR
jgi:threonine/homoserine/homoserine lactone efflux protein